MVRPVGTANQAGYPSHAPCAPQAHPDPPGYLVYPVTEDWLVWTVPQAKTGEWDNQAPAGPQEDQARAEPMASRVLTGLRLSLRHWYPETPAPWVSQDPRDPQAQWETPEKTVPQVHLAPLDRSAFLEYLVKTEIQASRVPRETWGKRGRRVFAPRTAQQTEGFSLSTHLRNSEFHAFL